MFKKTGSTPRVPGSVVLRKTWKFAFLMSSQVVMPVVTLRAAGQFISCGKNEKERLREPLIREQSKEKDLLRKGLFT